MYIYIYTNIDHVFGVNIHLPAVSGVEKNMQGELTHYPWGVSQYVLILTSGVTKTSFFCCVVLFIRNRLGMIKNGWPEEHVLFDAI